MQKATTLRELRKVFRFSDKYLEEEDDNVYVDLYKKEMANLEFDIEETYNHYDTFYITGQTGNGKSTAVNYLKNNNDYIKQHYDVRHIFARDIFDYSDEVTIIDVLLMVGVTLVEGDKKLEKKYYDKLQELKDAHVGKLQKSTQEESSNQDSSSYSAYAKGEVGFLSIFKFGSDLKKEFISNENSRTLLRRLFLPNRKELLDLVNEIIKDYNLSSNGKKLFLILDDLEKKQHISDELFTTHKEILEKLEVLKIIMIPVNYATNGRVYKLTLRLAKNPINSSHKSNDTDIEKNINSLKDLIYKRIDKEYYHLIPNNEDVVNRLIEYSGGNIRQLLILISNAVRSCILSDGEIVSKIDIDDSIENFLNTIAIGVIGRIKFLKLIDAKHISVDKDNNDDFKESISDNTIFAYFNGQPWYEVNPVLKNYIKNIKL